MKSQNKPITVYILIVAMIFQAISGLLGGCLFVYDPSGEFMQMPLSMLKDTKFPNYLVPGLTLLLLLGIFPSFVAIRLIKKSGWKWANKLNIYKDQKWAWTYSLFVSIMLIIWIDVQIMLIGYGAPIQIVYAFVGVFLLIMTLMPCVKKYYTKN